MDGKWDQRTATHAYTALLAFQTMDFQAICVIIFIIRSGEIRKDFTQSAFGEWNATENNFAHLQDVPRICKRNDGDGNKIVALNECGILHFITNVHMNQIKRAFVVQRGVRCAHSAQV